MYYIYLTTNSLNDKKYIGQHKTNYIKTEDMLNDRYFGKGARIKELIKKHGKSIFSKEILQICDEKKDAEEWEIYYIDSFNAIQSSEFYNMNRTSSSGHTSKYIDNMSETKKEYYKNNPLSQSKVMKDYYSRQQNKDKLLKSIAVRLGFDSHEEYIKERKKRRLDGMRIHLINKLREYRNIRMKQDKQYIAEENGYRTYLEYYRATHGNCGGGRTPEKPNKGYGKYSSTAFKQLIEDKKLSVLAASQILNCHKTTLLFMLRGYQIQKKGIRSKRYVKDFYYEYISKYI